MNLQRPSTAVLIPTWREAPVIGDTVSHALKAWQQDNLRLYVGCYRNDPETIAAIVQSAGGDSRLRIVIHDQDGPTTKADCLNRLYFAMRDDEQRLGARFRMAVFHDAEDMVDPAALSLLDEAMNDADFAQIPVEPQVHPDSRWLGSHYCEEFAESHGKGMVVRDALGAALPAAGVGCAASRESLERLRAERADGQPFSTDSLTEDYELGLNIGANGGRCRFLRAVDEHGRQIATRAFFPARLDQIVRQKTRWVHGIAFQGWDRMGWSGNMLESWMRARDRRGPITALVLAVGYSLLLLTGLLWILASVGGMEPETVSPMLKALLLANLAAFVWRAVWRFAFTARIYGFAEGVRAVLRIPLSNIIAIMAGRRALFAYIRSLLGHQPIWDKTPHYAHPVRVGPAKAATA
ncbi:MAG: glycosyl transferase family protein [Pseudomonadota bacterium]